MNIFLVIGHDFSNEFEEYDDISSDKVKNRNFLIIDHNFKKCIFISVQLRYVSYKSIIYDTKKKWNLYFLSWLAIAVTDDCTVSMLILTVIVLQYEIVSTSSFWYNVIDL